MDSVATINSEESVPTHHLDCLKDTDSVSFRAQSDAARTHGSLSRRTNITQAHRGASHVNGACCSCGRDGSHWFVLHLITPGCTAFLLGRSCPARQEFMNPSPVAIVELQLCCWLLKGW